jgi:hypothetical protein
MQSRVLNRRAFLKLGVCFLSDVAGIRIHRQPILANNPSAPLMTPYGAGAYGQGTYPGYIVYLPIVKKGGN